ncbi:MAG TPA: preprotein translocase subunit SecA [Acidimicrobiales bacterium]|nr:preprotein translocase subunit SecA [Acidimicrobiales bacterium]
MSVFAKVLRAGEGRKVRRLAEVVPLINALEDEVSAMSDEELAHMTVEFRARLDAGEELNDLLVEAFAVVRETSRRTIGQRHFDVQLMGGMALHFGWIAEMKTGEGKTLASTLAVYLNALTKKGVHVVTVNEYLARRDSEWMGQIYRFLGLSVGLVVPEIDSFDDKRAAYLADITYGTNTEFGFDYLRDNMAPSRGEMVQRGHHYAIVDEVDSILIDEARTPLIISGPSDDATKLYYQFASVARTLVRDVDYEVDEEKNLVVPTEEGIAKVERQLGVENLYDAVAVNYVHQLGKALEAKELYHRDKDYIVADGEAKIVDEFTGRVLEGRRWSDGLHQAVEAKERVRIKEENHTWATVTLQNYFRMYKKLAGMTGTAETEAAEFASTYMLEVVPIPTNEPMIRTDHADLIFKSEDAKFRAVVDDLVARYESGQPVLVGTASVERSEHLSRLLDKQGIPHSVLNAKHHAREAAIVAQAGRLKAITVATNMAGRGVDIVLGGNPEGLARETTIAEGLDPASEEGLARHGVLLEKFATSCAAEAGQVLELGGLYVLGSERHESRRIDNQLRGRSGRQGDPGESRFYLSLEDELMRIFASGAMSWVMDRALPEDIPIEARMVTRAIERAQATVEQRNAEIRKDVLKYDEVMNEQRKVIYERRMQVIDGDDLRERTLELLAAKVASLVAASCPTEFSEEWDLERLVAECAQYYPTRFSVADLAQAESTEQLVESIYAEALEYYEDREETIPGGLEGARDLERQIMLQIIDQRWRYHLAEMDYLREGIHLRSLAQTDPLVAWQREGFEMFGLLMAAIDDDYLRYVMHVEVMTGEEAAPDFRQATYEAAADPATPFAVSVGPEVVSAGALEPTPGASVRAAGPTAGVALAGVPRPPKTKLGRNEPCWCGSGRKFKLCHGAT